MTKLTNGLLSIEEMKHYISLAKKQEYTHIGIVGKRIFAGRTMYTGFCMCTID